MEKNSTSAIKEKVKISNIVRWIFGVLFILTGIANISSSPFASIFYVLAGLVLLPTFWKIAEDKGYMRLSNLSRNQKVILFIVLIFVAGSLSGSHTASDTSSLKPTQQVMKSQQPTAKPALKTIEATKPTPKATEVPKPSSSPTPTPTDIPHDANGFPENYQNVTVANLSKAPSDYNNKTIVFTCDVLSFPKDSSGNATAINCSDPNDYGSIVQIDATVYDVTKINTGDTINIYGQGAGAFTGKNAYGGDVTESLVSGMYINDITSGYSNSK